MILTILKLGWLNLRRDRVALALTFALPIVFFSIFASVFGGQGSGTSRIRIAVVDEDHSESERTDHRRIEERNRAARPHRRRMTTAPEPWTGLPAEQSSCAAAPSR